MFGSDIVDVGIGIVFIYLLLSLIASTIREGLEIGLKTRSKTLRTGIAELLHERENSHLVPDVYRHPLIAPLYRGEFEKISARELPSYIPARNFAVALLDIVARGPVSTASAPGASAAPVTFDVLRKRVAEAEIPNPVRRALMTAMDTAQGDLLRVQHNVEAWFDSSMERVSGWYKRQTFWMLFVIGASLTVAMNVNTISLLHYLSEQKEARDVLVDRASVAARDPNLRSRPLDSLRVDLEVPGLPIGWTAKSIERNPLNTALGWLLTAVAITLGAPFWFDLLNKFMVVRSTVKPNEKSGVESSKDPQKRESRGPVGSTAAAPGGAIFAGGAGSLGALATSPGFEDLSFEPHGWKDGDSEAGDL